MAPVSVASSFLEGKGFARRFTTANKETGELFSDFLAWAWPLGSVAFYFLAISTKAPRS